LHTFAPLQTREEKIFARLLNSSFQSASTFARASACAFARACSSEEGAFGAGPGAPDAAAGAREDDDGAGAAGPADA